METIGIYVHVPFCRSKCRYCDFYSLPDCTEEQKSEYVDALISHFKEYFYSGHAYQADSIYIGGGTPSVLGGKKLKRLLISLKKRVQLAAYPEITVEVNPESADKKLFHTLKHCGVNRISMGVQSADDEELKYLGRIHTFAKAKQAVDLCRKYCTENVSLDLMFGLPGQTVEKVVNSLERFIELNPTHLSCYALKLESGTPMAKENPALPSDDEQADMYLAIVNRLKEAGYSQYEISNFARPGFESRHNCKYWDLSPYLGFGCGAHSYLGGKRFSFVPDLRRYIDGISGRKPVVEEADELSNGNRFGEYIMLKLRTSEGIDSDFFYRRFHTDFEPYAKKLEPFIAPGYVRKDGSKYHLTPEGFLVSNQIIGKVLEECLGDQKLPEI